MSWTLLDEVAETELLQLNVGKCEGPCERSNVPRLTCQSRRLDNSQEWTLCTWCAQEYEQFWDEMWQIYHDGLL